MKYISSEFTELYAFLYEIYGRKNWKVKHKIILKIT